MAAIAVLVLYLLPWFVSLVRTHPQSHAIGMLNLLLGWTVIGWIISLVWSLTSTKQVVQVEKAR